MKIQIDKRLLRSLVGELLKTAVQLHNDYQLCVEPFAALDQIYDRHFTFGRCVLMTNIISIELTGQEMHKLIKRLGHTGFIPYRLEDRRQLLIRPWD